MPLSSGTQPMPALARLSGEVRSSSRPSSRITPSTWRCRPMTERNSVVFPAPLRPTRVTTSPGLTASETSERTRASPYQAETPWTSSRGCALPADDLAAMSGEVSDMGLAQVCRDDLLVVAHLLVGPFREDLTGLQHRDRVGQRPDHVHVVVDEDDREPAGDIL